MANKLHSDIVPTLELLAAVQENESTTQRDLATRIGVALGLTNSILKRAVRKGLIKIAQAPAKRYAYYLTPKGFSEKSRLVAQYLETSLSFFRIAKQQYLNLLVQPACGDHQPGVVMLGRGELAEIASLAVSESGLSVVGIFDKGANVETFAGHPVIASVENCDENTIFLLTDSQDPQGFYEKMAALVPDERILIPEILRIVRRSAETARAGGAP